MIYFTNSVVFVVPEDSESKDFSVPENSLSKDTSVPEDSESKDTSVSEDSLSKDTSVTEDSESKVTSVFDESSATGETQQSSSPTVINDIVVPDNSYSKYCFFFLMLLFALFVGRSFRKGV